MKEPIASIKTEEGLASSILYKRLDFCMKNIVESLPKLCIKNESIDNAIRLQLFAKMALDTIPVTKYNKKLYNIALDHWSEVNKLIMLKLNAPEYERVITYKELQLFHLLDSDIVKCIDSAGLGWGDFYGLTTKGDVIRSYIEKGR